MHRKIRLCDKKALCEKKSVKFRLGIN